MFFLLSKLFQFLTQPFTWIVFCFTLGYFLKRKWLKRLCIASFFIFTNAFILDEVNRLWEIRLTVNENIPKHAIVLGGMASYDQTLDAVQFHAGSDRLWQAIKLYKCEKIDKLVLSSGAASILHQDIKEADIVESYLLDVDLANEDFYFENQAKNTYENAVNTKALFEQNSWPLNITLVTSSFHMRRAKACFIKQGFTVTPYVTNRKSGPRKFEFDHLVIPNAETLTGWNTLIHELIGFVIYKVQGYC